MAANAENELIVWFENELLPEVLREGHFPTGKNPRIAKCKFETTESSKDHFASSAYFLQLTVESDEGQEVLDLIVKFCCQNEEICQLFLLKEQFQNEVAVYGTLLKEFRELLLKNPKVPSDFLDRIIPKCYYCRFDADNPKKSLLIFENENRNGYRTAKSLIFLDYDHCAVAMKQIGKFHALSFAMKIKCPELLTRLQEHLVESRFADVPTIREGCRIFNRICNQRAIDYLLSQNPPKVPKDYLLAMKEMLSHPFELFRRLITPREPLAIICHGDYCRNNILFRFEGDHAADAKMFDFQLTRFANPSIDLSFFIYLNTTQQIRDQHLDEFLRIYHSSLISTTAEILGVPEIEVSTRYPLKLFTDDFAERAVFGYCLVAFFLGVMVSDQENDFFWERSLEEQANFLVKVGGEEISEKIGDVIYDFYKRGFYAT